MWKKDNVNDNKDHRYNDNNSKIKIYVQIILRVHQKNAVSHL